MNGSFYQSAHCTSRAHCSLCRDKQAGRYFRRSLAQQFDDIKEADFTCPAGLPWGTEKQRMRLTEPPPSFKEAKAAILAAPDSGLWLLLKEELRLREENIERNAHLGGCWRRRQRRALVEQYEVARAKTQASTQAQH